MECVNKFDKKKAFNSLLFAYTYKLANEQDKLCIFLSQKLLELLYQNKDPYYRLCFITVLPKFLNECQLKKLKPLIHMINQTYYSSFYLNQLQTQKNKVESLQNEINKLKTGSKKVTGRVTKVELQYGNIKGLCIPKLVLTSAVDPKKIITVKIRNSEVCIIDGGTNFCVGETLFSIKQHGLSFIFEVCGLEEVLGGFTHKVDVDDVHAQVPMYIFVYSLNGKKTCNYSLEMLDLIKYEEECYGSDFIIKKYLLDEC